MQNILDVTRKTLGWMASGPDSLVRGLAASSDDVEIVAKFVEHVRTASSSDAVFNLLNQKLSSWDYDSAASWADSTPNNSVGRRKKIYELLRVEQDFAEVLNEKFPPNLNYDAPIVIAKEHTPWYDDERQVRQAFYRDAYANYLRTRKGWKEDQILGLEESTRLVTERLSDPESPTIRPIRGLVVGYVQSGKTANFTGVVARAADAGYRLIIVLAGTLNILRSQTQRRMDRELIGIPFITADDDPEYATDLENFIDHRGQPSECGAFDWYRLTGSGKDYQRLLYGIDALRFRKQDKNKPFNHPSNLHGESARLLIVKKTPAVLKKFADDLAKIKKTQSLAEIPTLIIDDESDQASINTRKPTVKEIEDRTATNSAIVSLLKELPRAQYVGYTATPFANVFVDPNNDEDLFPRDFIISLPRPTNYMGVADFHDLDRPDKELPGPNELAFVRDVKGDDSEIQNLQQAIDSYILAGALKLYRANRRPELDKAFRHHTMLVHISHLTDSHHETAKLVSSLLENGGYLNGRAKPRMKKLWETDFERVCRDRASGYPIPANFGELGPFFGECWARLTSSFKPVLTINGDSADNPDFESSSVWKIVVGGAKLSRGYTIEGLTVSYYRRRAGAADALMQMGRWFGFRDGYRDLVRLYIGREEPLSTSASKEAVGASASKNAKRGKRAKKKKTIDLYRAFEAACLDEMEFRDELKKYAKPVNGKPILPIQVPPLVPSHLLRPTSPNKMYNTKVEFKNFAKAWKEHVVAPVGETDIIHNQQLLAAMVKGDLETGTLSVENAIGTFEHLAKWKTIEAKKMLKFLESYRWAGGDTTVLQRETEFLKSEKNGITEWLFLYFEGPQRSELCQIGGTEFRVYNRTRTDERFNVYSESVHRPIVKYLCGAEEAEPDNVTTSALRNTTRAIFVFYPTADLNEKDNPEPQVVTPGFALQFPDNDNPMQIRFTVLVKSREHEPIANVDVGAQGKTRTKKRPTETDKTAGTMGKKR